MSESTQDCDIAVFMEIYSVRGYEPRILRNAQERSSSDIAFWTRGSERCPKKSTKKMYSHARCRVGRDSIFVIFRCAFLKGINISCRAPTRSLTENMMEVLSRPVGAGSDVPMTRKRV